MTLDQQTETAVEWKDLGNKYYGEKNFVEAAKAYQGGLDALGGERDETPLSVALRSNLAMVLLKLQEYQQADEECTRILKIDPQNTKVLYRRAMAREGSMHNVKFDSPEHQKTQLIQAIDDLQRCLNILDGQSEQNDKLRMKESCQTALDRLEMSYNKLERENCNDDHDEQQSDLQNSTTQSKKHDIDDVSQQKKDVMRLLIARQTMGAIPKGEAFFLLDWKWWCEWCRRVDFFHGNDSPGKQSDEKISQVLKLLPPGAVLPDNDDSCADSDDSSCESESVGILGPIDNSSLFLEKSIFHRQWYDTSSIKPNLVRGYHYELLPREVYNALRSWYGETTSNVCRRTTPDGAVVLYPSRTQTSTGKSVAHKCSACSAVGATARCKRCMSVQYCDRGCQEAHWPYHKSFCKAHANVSSTQKQYQPHGRIGLNNLGNTCFMNSALQCLSHATPLTRHFLSNRFRADVNTSNPLGTGGKLALAYDTVLKELWMKSKATATSPTALKRAIALFAPRFAGCLQHDAQEFLAYLLDGLHEDLNRIRKAPYVEMPDVTDGHNMAIKGAEAWDAHKRRNDSLVLDSFYGQFQSTCICPKCNKVSVSFDAFNHVSLEIPQFQKLTMMIPILVFRAGSAESPIRYGVTLRRHCLILDLKRSISELTGIAQNRLIICDVYDNSIYELLHDKKPISNIRPNDVIAAYEVDPFTKASIHVVATHSLKMLDDDGQEQRPLFGFPFMTSFDANASCGKVWEHIWNAVDHLASEEGHKEGFVDKSSRYRREEILKVRVVNSQGEKLEVFPTTESTKTSLLPFNSKVKIRDLLGKNCTDSFLFLSLEWENPNSLDHGITKLINPQSFIVYSDHTSLIEAMRSQRTTKGSNGVSLDQCLETFTKPERLDEHNMWYCSKCKEHVRALKTMKLWRLPNILVIHLKRFEFKHALRRDKLDTFVDFPLQGLDMSNHCSTWKSSVESEEAFLDSKMPAEYDLFAVVNHYGRMGFGHYTAFARQWDEIDMSDEWALFDDSSVRPVGNGKGTDGVVTPAAYVLFYRRRIFS